MTHLIHIHGAVLDIQASLGHYRKSDSVQGEPRPNFLPFVFVTEPLHIWDSGVFLGLESMRLSASQQQ